MQEYKVVQFNTTDFQDNFGNTWCNVAFEGVSEPVKWVVKDPTKVFIDQIVYGEITDETSKTNKPYRRFRSKPRPEGTENAPQGQSDEYWANKQNQIKAQWAIGQAVQLYGMQIEALQEADVEDIKYLEDQAKELFAMVDRIANPVEIAIDPYAVDITNLNDDLPL